MSIHTKIKPPTNAALRARIDALGAPDAPPLLAQWALSTAEQALRLAGIAPLDHPDILTGINALLAWQRGDADLPDMREIGFRILALARTDESPLRAAALRAAGYAVCSGAHSGHAANVSRYALEAVRLLHPGDRQAHADERLRQWASLSEPCAPERPRFSPKTLYLSDLDGTLLNPSAQLSASSREKLNALIEQGLRFSIATARTGATALRILDGLQLNEPVALMNGVMIYDASHGRYLDVRYLTAEAVAQVIAALAELGLTGLMYELKDGQLATYYESLDSKPLRDFVEERRRVFGKRFEQIDRFAEAQPEHVIYFAMLDTQERLAPLRDRLADCPDLGLVLYKDNYSTDLWYLEIFSARASKREAALALKELGGFDRVVGFGDNLNDLPLFEACDYRLAVGNAHPTVRAAADEVIGSNAEDGVARWIDAQENPL